MGNHCKPAKKQWTSYVTTAVALEAASLFGFFYATDSHIPGVDLLDTTIFIDGTKDVLPTSEPYDPYRMQNTLQGAYAQDGADVLFDCQDDQCTTFQSGDNVFIVYPRSAGVVTGPTDPTYDASEAIATDRILLAIAQAQALERADSDTEDAIYVVGYSQGAGAAAQALERLGELEDTGNIEQFVLIANPRRNDGGILARLPEGFYVPLVGATGGDGTTNPYGITVIQVTKQYDGIADAPKDFLNVVADANAAMGFYYLHRDIYQNVRLDYNGDGTVNQQDFDQMQTDGYATVTYNVGDKLTDVLVLTPVGQLPLTRPLLDAGVPPEVVAAMDPAVRAVIEAGYDRPQPGGEYPSEPVHFEPLPTSTTDMQAIADQSGALLAGTVQPNVSDAVQLSRSITATAPPALTTSMAEEPISTSVTTTSGDAQPALRDAGMDEASKAQPTRRTVEKADPTLHRTNRSSATGGTDTDAADTANATATSSSSTTSGSSTGSPSSAGSTSTPSN